MITREWAMPNKHTFQIPPIKALLARWISPGDDVADPFAGSSLWGTDRNDLAESGVDAEVFVRSFNILFDAVLFDPPYSPRQISEVYKSVGLAVGTEETQNGRLYKRVKDALDEKLRPGGLAISCGWNSSGFGKGRKYEQLEILLVCHGGAHNDTIVVVERKL